MMTVGARVLGQRGGEATWEVAPPTQIAAAGTLSLRDLITYLVHQEMEAFQSRQERRSLLRVLSEAEMDAEAATGRVISGGQELRQAVDPTAAVATALQAFTDGMYLVAVDGRQVESLDEPISLRSESTVTFLRLTLLAGG